MHRNEMAGMMEIKALILYKCYQKQKLRSIAKQKAERMRKGRKRLNSQNACICINRTFRRDELVSYDHGIKRYCQHAAI